MVKQHKKHYKGEDKKPRQIKKEGKGPEQNKARAYKMEISKMQSDIRSFIDKFRLGVAQKREDYLSYSRHLRKQRVS